jgi:hypothetical protein
MGARIHPGVGGDHLGGPSGDPRVASARVRDGVFAVAVQHGFEHHGRALVVQQPVGGLEHGFDVLAVDPPAVDPVRAQSLVELARAVDRDGRVVLRTH